jgi:hypothetical protein
VQINLGKGTASLRLKDLPISDFHNIPNSLAGGPSVPAMVSFDVRWRDVIQRDTIRDQVNGFAGQFIENTATIQWSATTDEDFAFESDENTFSYALIGKERNGVFFPQGSETQTRRGDP